jgi:hypothetical protein
MSEINPDDSVGHTTPYAGAIVTVLSVVLILTGVAWSADLFRTTGFIFYTEQYLGGMLTIAFPLVYLHVPAGKGRSRQGPVPWYDMVMAVLGFGGRPTPPSFSPISARASPIGRWMRCWSEPS